MIKKVCIIVLTLSLNTLVGYTIDINNKTSRKLEYEIKRTAGSDVKGTIEPEGRITKGVGGYCTYEVNVKDIDDTKDESGKLVTYTFPDAYKMRKLAKLKYLRDQKEDLLQEDQSNERDEKIKEIEKEIEEIPEEAIKKSMEKSKKRLKGRTAKLELAGSVGRCGSLDLKVYDVSFDLKIKER
jgi:hypothetical protein